jgi:signal transduction histidine kinase
VLLAKALRSSTFRLALIFIAIFGAAMFVLFGYVYWSTASYVRGRSDATIAAEQASLRKLYDREGRAALVAAIENRVANDRLQRGVYALADPSFARVAGDLNAWPASLREATGWHDLDARESKSAGGSATLRAMVETLPDGYHLLVGRDSDDLHELTTSIETALLGGVALLFVIAAVASITITRRAVGRVEALMAEVKQVSDNVAHDLRTPLTRMRARLEKANNRRRDSEQDQSLIGDTMADLDAVLRMFASLTRISQIEARDRTAAFRTVNLAEIASEVVELFDAAAEDKHAQLDAVGNQRVLVTGDRDLLFDAVANLVDNAIKYGRDAGRVTVEVTQNDRGAVVAVADDGPGIPDDERQHVFKRFYRLERSRHTPGNGLGLSLVAAVARLHGAHIEMLDNKPGLRCRLQFPLPTRW